MCKKCSECGKESEDLTMVDEVTYVCPDCLDGLYFHCDECDEYWKYGYEKVKKLAVTDGFLRTASGYQFYNTSKFTFDRLLADPENIESNFRDYLSPYYRDHASEVPRDL